MPFEPRCKPRCSILRRWHCRENRPANMTTEATTAGSHGRVGWPGPCWVQEEKTADAEGNEKLPTDAAPTNSQQREWHEPRATVRAARARAKATGSEEAERAASWKEGAVGRREGKREAERYGHPQRPARPSSTCTRRELLSLPCNWTLLHREPKNLLATHVCM